MEDLEVMRCVLMAGKYRLLPFDFTKLYDVTSEHIQPLENLKTKQKLTFPQT